jgi:hypothetical protein
MMPSIANDRAEVAVGISPPTRASVANDRAEVAVGNCLHVGRLAHKLVIIDFLAAASCSTGSVGLFQVAMTAIGGCV